VNDDSPHLYLRLRRCELISLAARGVALDRGFAVYPLRVDAEVVVLSLLASCRANCEYRARGIAGDACIVVGACASGLSCFLLLAHRQSRDHELLAIHLVADVLVEVGEARLEGIFHVCTRCVDAVISQLGCVLGEVGVGWRWCLSLVLPRWLGAVDCIELGDLLGPRL
jgi:hypothetical protein